MTTSISYIDNTDNEQRTVTLDAEQILQGLGPHATEADAQAFARAWNTRFFDEDGKPTFYDDEDRDATWAEIVQMIA